MDLGELEITVFTTGIDVVAATQAQKLTIWQHCVLGNTVPRHKPKGFGVEVNLWLATCFLPVFTSLRPFNHCNQFRDGGYTVARHAAWNSLAD